MKEPDLSNNLLIKPDRKHRAAAFFLRNIFSLNSAVLGENNLPGQGQSDTNALRRGILSPIKAVENPRLIL